MDDHEMVRVLLGREPQGAFEVVVRDQAGWPVVIRNAPFLDDGTPMPTRYWLTGEDAVRRVGRLEAAGGVRAAERAVDSAALADAHARHARERDGEIPADHVGPRPAGGVGGTRAGIKCLHAHYAWFLAGGDDPVGRWVDGQLRAPAPVVVDLGAECTAIACATSFDAPPWQVDIPIGIQVTARELESQDPPAPAALTNAIGVMEDRLDDLRRDHPELVAHTDVHIRGALARSLARVEIGHDQLDGDVVVDRDAAEDVFRTLVTEARDDRAHNPGLPAEHVAEAPAAACLLVAVMRRLHLDRVTIDAGGEGT